MKLLLLLGFLSFGLVGCSGSKSAQSVDSETPQVELSDADEFVDDSPADDSMEITESDVQSPEVIEPSDVAIEETPGETPAEDPSLVQDSDQTSIDDTETFAAAPQDTAPVASNDFSSGSEKTYTVQKNETLMLIAFKLYGDYEKWKELATYNRDTLRGSTSLSAGMKLKYMAPAEEFVWNPEGTPYLIRTGDTLGGISTTVYSTPKKWKMIWDNNRPLIKDPNRIFAGFTIYYLESGRDVAAEL